MMHCHGCKDCPKPRWYHFSKQSQACCCGRFWDPVGLRHWDEQLPFRRSGFCAQQHNLWVGHETWFHKKSGGEKHRIINISQQQKLYLLVPGSVHLLPNPKGYWKELARLHLSVSYPDSVIARYKKSTCCADRMGVSGSKSQKNLRKTLRGRGFFFF